MFDKIIELFNKNDGILTTKQVEEIGYSRHLLSNMLKKGLIERVENNTYSLKNVEKDEYYLLQLKYPNVVFSYETALYFYDMLDRTPIDINVTIPTSYSGSDLKKEKNIVVYYAKGNAYNKGITSIETPCKNVVRAYSIEKTICDIINNDKMIDKQIYLNAIKKYARMKDKDLILLDKYAKMYDIEVKLKQLMDALI
ncbi:MAG: type IV toxin-antitoxin system AbiEi family antitoxin domain-containing protein [Clostridia bacterium]|nr:type IV toxin-antitoxin system AbiEi family antitoxin domain-containing protein [Clostridia bacterium]MDD4387006.1 type IV toxin-antitoxin system AbiEi family antitoxin domain-containing protein [Clostridia bacterium]